MNREQYIANISLEIDDNIARLVSKIDDDISEIWKIEKKDILEAIHFKEQLIKYLENMLEGTIKDEFIVTGVKDLLNKVRSGKYE